MNTDWSRTTKYILGVCLGLLGIFILYISRAVIPLLIIAALIAVVVRPAVIWLTAGLRMPRGLAVALVYLIVLVLFPVAALLAVPAIVDAVRYVLGLDYQAILRSSVDWVRTTLTAIQAAQFPIKSLDTYIDQLVVAFLAVFQTPEPATPVVIPSVTTIIQSLGAALTATFSTVVGLVGAVVSNLLLVIFIFLASVYMNLSAHTYREAFLRSVPEAYRPEITELLDRIELLWNRFFRGELTLMLVIGVLCWLGLAILGVPGALYLGIVAGLLELVPNLGPVISAIPAVIVALLQGSTHFALSPFAVALLVIALYIVVQQLENSLIVPRVLGDAVDLPALVVMTGVLVGAGVGGILGTLLATPVIATGREVLRYIYRKMMGQTPFPPKEVKAPVRSSLGLSERFRRWIDSRRKRAGTQPKGPGAVSIPRHPDVDP